MFKLSGSNHPNLLLVYEKARKIYDENFLLEKRRKRRKLFRNIRRFSIGIITIFCLISFYLMAHLINLYHIQKEAMSGKKNIDEAITLLERQENESALYYSKLAKNNFELSSGYLREYKNSFTVKTSDFFFEQYSDLDYLLSAATTLSSAVSQMAKMQNNLDEIFLSDDKDKEYFLNFIYESTPEIFGVKANIDLSLSYFSGVKYSGILNPFKEEIQGIEKKLSLVSYLLDQQIALTQILPSFLGYPNETKYLTIFQNNNKLTANGGEMTAYGILKNKLGKVESFESFSSRDLDEKAKDFLNVAPPSALTKNTGKTKWFLSDTNWSPDWLYAADKMLWFYQQESGDNSRFDGVILLNSDFIKEILTLTGPIVVDNNSYSVTNFSRIFEKDGKKGDLAKIIQKAQEKISSQELGIFDIFTLLSSNFSKKNILLYFNDINFQTIAEEKGWSNKISETNSDYFMVVDSNLSELNNENKIKKKIDYIIDQGSNGLFAKLDITYLNTLNENSLDGTYKNYVRIYVPLGSELLIFKGIEDGSLEILEDNKNKKAIYAGIFNIEPGKIENLELYYKLPERINNLALSGDYKLLVQKQPGLIIDSLGVDLNFINSIKLYNPTGFSADLVNDKQIVWTTNLLTDRYFSINF